jgi:hypothetical protein
LTLEPYPIPYLHAVDTTNSLGDGVNHRSGEEVQIVDLRDKAHDKTAEMLAFQRPHDLPQISAGRVQHGGVTATQRFARAVDALAKDHRL